MIQEIFQDAESVRSGPSHVPRQPALFPLFRDPGEMLSRSVGMPSRNDRPPHISDTHGISGNVFFVNPPACSSSPYILDKGSTREFQRVGTHITACKE